METYQKVVWDDEEFPTPQSSWQNHDSQTSLWDKQLSPEIGGTLSTSPCTRSEGDRMERLVGTAAAPKFNFPNWKLE